MWSLYNQAYVGHELHVGEQIKRDKQNASLSVQWLGTVPVQPIVKVSLVLNL